MGKGQIRQKTVYRPRRTLDVFYTKGDVELSDKGILACTCADNIKLVDVATGEVVYTLTADDDGEPITALTINPANSPTGARVYGASRSLQLHCWDGATGKKIRSWKGHKGPVLDMSLFPRGSHLATAGADGTVKVWDTEGFYCTHNFENGHSGVVRKVIWHSADLRIISGGHDGNICIWDLVTKARVAKFQAHKSPVTVLALTADGRTLVTAGKDELIKVWDIRRTPKEVVALTPFEAIEGLAILPQGAHFPGAGQAKKGKTAEGPKPVSLITVGTRGTLRVWNSDAPSKPTYELQAAGQNPPADGEGLAGVSLRPDGGLLVSTEDGRLLLYDVEGGKSDQEKGGKRKADKGSLTLSLSRQLIGNLDTVTDTCFVGPTANPTHIAVATNSAVPRLFDVETLSCTSSLIGHTDIVLGLDGAVSGDGQTLLATVSKDTSVRIWDTSSGACLGIGKGHIAAVSAVAFSRRNAKFVVTGGVDKLLRVWDVASLLKGAKGSGAGEGNKLSKEGKEKALLALAAVAAHEKDINGVAVSPNDALICTASQDRTAKIWRMPDLVLATTLRGHRRGVWACAFSPVDPVVVTACGDALIRLFSTADGACLKSFEGHDASVLRACFLSAGTQIVSSGSDAKIKLWAVRTTECTATFDCHDGKVWALATGGTDESLLVSGGEDGKLNLWEDCTAVDEAAAASEAASAVHKQQQLANALKAENFTAAAQLAFELGQPRRLLAVVDAARARGPEAAEPILAMLAAGLEPAQLKQCLEYVREWNTNSRQCHAAQALLKAVFLYHPPETLLAVPGISQLIEGLTGYSQRHAARLDRLLRATHLLDYTLAACRVLHPLGEAGAAATIEAGGTENGTAAGVATPELATETPVRPRVNGRGVYPRAGADTPSSSTDESDGDPEGPSDVGGPLSNGGARLGEVESVSPDFSQDDSGSDEDSESESGSGLDQEGSPGQGRREQRDMGQGASPDGSDEDAEGEEGEESDGMIASDEGAEGEEGEESEGVVASEDEDGGTSSDQDSDGDRGADDAGHSDASDAEAGASDASDVNTGASDASDAEASTSDASDAEAGASDASDVEAAAATPPPTPASGAGVTRGPGTGRRVRGHAAALQAAVGRGPGQAGTAPRTGGGSGPGVVPHMGVGEVQPGRTLRSGRKRKSEGSDLRTAPVGNAQSKAQKTTRKR